MKRIAIIAPCVLPVPATNGGAVENLIQRILDDNEINNDCLIDLFTIKDDGADAHSYKNTTINSIKKGAFTSARDKVSDKYYRTFGGNVSVRRALDTNIVAAFRTRYLELHSKDSTVYDAIIVENIASTALSIVALRGEGIAAPTYFHIHNEVDIYRSEDDIRRLTAAGVQFIAVSQFIKSEILKADVNALVKVLYNGVDFDKFCVNPLIDNNVANPQNDKNTVKFLYAGRIIPDKGVLELLKAYILFVGKNQEKAANTHLDIVGFGTENTAYESQIIKLAKQYPSFVSCLPKVAASEMPGVYSAHSAVFMPTLNEEPFGLVALEAMACGCPILVTNSGGLLEVVDSQSAICAKKSTEPGSNVDKELLQSELVSAFETLLSSEKRRDLRAKGLSRAKAIPEFDIKNYEASFMDMVGVKAGKTRPLVSVIITAYNIKNYIDRAINSAMRQTYDNLEVILVDDGSSDGTEKICDSFADTNENVKMIHEENLGISAARNAGIKAATGDYIFFLDGDDSIEPNTIEKLLYVCEKHDVGVSCCGAEMVYEDGSKKTFTSANPAFYSGHQSVIQFMMSNDVCTVLWNKLYKASLWDGVSFPVGRVHEDEASLYRVLEKAKIVSYIPEILYKYTQREGSIMHDNEGKRLDDFLTVVDERIVHYKDDPELLSYSVWVKLGHIKYFYKQYKDKEIRKRLAELFDTTIGAYGVPYTVGIKKKLGLLVWKLIKY